MSGWEQNSANQQGFYNPDGSSFYGNYAPGNEQSYAPGMSYLSPTPLESAAPYGADGEVNYVDDEFNNEPPLLEELGINPEHIFQKTLTVLNPFRATRAEVAGDSDLAGPLVTNPYFIKIADNSFQLLFKVRHHQSTHPVLCKICQISSLQHNIQSSFWLVLVFWRLLKQKS